MIAASISPQTLMFIRAKHASDPLDDKAKARLRGDCSSNSGSEHEADPLFSGPIHAFLQLDDSHAANALVSDADVDNVGRTDTDNSNSDDIETVRDLLESSKRSDPFLARLQSDIVSIAKALEGTSSRESKSGFRRAVMSRLRDSGYNAGICKAKWESSGSLPAGSYEYVDVVVGREKERYIVDTEFVTEFEVARATEEYAKLLSVLPRVVVGRSEEVRQLVRILEGAARRSLKSRELTVPPWRKRRYVLAKWLGPYRRTVNFLPTAPARAEVIECRAVVGFGAPVGNFSG